jgi:hypothetical protein
MQAWRLIQLVEQDVDQLNHRYGQALYNRLAEADVPGLGQLVGTLDDPFFRIKSRATTKNWIGRHLVVDCGDNILEAKR